MKLTIGEFEFNTMISSEKVIKMWHKFSFCNKNAKPRDSKTTQEDLSTCACLNFSVWKTSFVHCSAGGEALCGVRHVQPSRE